MTGLEDETCYPRRVKGKCNGCWSLFECLQDGINGERDQWARSDTLAGSAGHLGPPKKPRPGEQGRQALARLTGEPVSN